MFKVIIEICMMIDQKEALTAFINRFFDKPELEPYYPVLLHTMIYMDLKVPKTLTAIFLRWLKGDREEYRINAIDGLNYLAGGYTQTELLWIGRELIEIYPFRQLEIDDTTICSTIIQGLHDENLNIIYSYIVQMIGHDPLYVDLLITLYQHCSASFLEKVIKERPEELEYSLSDEIWRVRNRMGLENTPGLNKIFQEEFNRQYIPFNASYILPPDYFAAKIPMVMQLDENLQEQMIQYIISTINEAPAPDEQIILAILYSFPVIKTEYHGNVKAYFEKLLSADKSSAAMLVIENLHRVPVNSLEMIESMTLENTIENSLLKFSCVCEREIRLSAERLLINTQQPRGLST